MGLVKAKAAPAAVETATPAELDDADAALRRRAATARGDVPGSEPALIGRLVVETEPSVREALLLALVQQGTPAAAEGLARLLEADDPALRNGALESLAALPERAAELLHALGRSADPDVRIFAVLLAGDVPGPGMGDWVARAIDGETDPNVCAAGLEVLLRLGDAGGEAVVDRVAARFRDEPFIQFLCSAFAGRTAA